MAITGGIGAGKSELLQRFERHGAAVISSDEIVHPLLRQDPDVKRAVVERFGEEVLGPTARSTAAPSPASSSRAGGS